MDATAFTITGITFPVAPANLTGFTAQAVAFPVATATATAPSAGAYVRARAGGGPRVTARPNGGDGGA